MSAAYPLAQMPFAASAIAIGGLVALYLLYQLAMPKPLPGIPYNKEAARSILGDAATLQKLRRSGGRPRLWFAEQSVKHNSPLVQIFVAPFAQPLLILSDFWETQDILLRRGKEFDRGGATLGALGGVIAHHHIGMRTTDPQFKANRELVKDLMTPNFLHTVSAPEIWNNTLKFIDLWKLKAKKADGHPFRADEDIGIMTFDIIKVVALGEGDSESMTEAYHEKVRRFDTEGQHPEKDAAFVFPANLPNEDLLAHQVQQEAVGTSVSIPFPSLFHKINNCRPSLRRSYACKDKMLTKQIGLALKRLEAGREVKSALDYMLKREINAAKKAERRPVLDSPYMRDELYGYIGAGHETSSTSFQWTIKHLAIHQDIQKKLRKALRAAYPEAAAENRQPTVAEITKIHVPYLEAVIEEALRLSGPVLAVVREAQVDTVVLGRRVPRGTQVIMQLRGPSITEREFAVDEALRSEGARSQKDARGAWAADPEAFLPERWLKTEEGGATAFDSQAGPFLTFSNGVRGCFGRRLAYLELRFLMTLVFWNFELGPLPEELNTFEAVDSLTTKPVKCFVRISETEP